MFGCHKKIFFHSYTVPCVLTKFSKLLMLFEIATPTKAKVYVVQFFLKDCSVHTREVPTVFSRLPSLMAADKPCPLLQPSLHGCTYEAEQKDKNKRLRPRSKKERRAVKRPHFFTFNFRYLCLCVLIIMIIISKYVWMSYGTKRSLSFFFFYQRIKRERGSVKNNVRVCSEYFFGWGSVIEISS